MVHAIQVQDPGSESEGIPVSDGSDSEGEMRRISEEKLVGTGGASQQPYPVRTRANAPEGSRIPERRPLVTGIIKNEIVVHIAGPETHTDLAAGNVWIAISHPTDRCLYAFRGCEDVHEAGECPMEEFFNQTHKWYDPTRHAGLFPEQEEKMLTKDARRVGIRYEPSVLSAAYTRM
ncbi:hypothetical protein PHMEG_00019613 [Phytophthora megakarya]|uniref:Uncharacterized protein n=1 Tax=Phytophthora megakarya TaxID=4795 RepID=A0A225VRZ5_9STRA|nr:hypothetical protein PHMEG_00019613 [Phytophthora megakarya]